VRVEATTESPLETDADTIVVGLIEGEGVAHDVAGDALGALLEAGEARAAFRRLAVTHAEGRRFILVGLGAREALDAERARIAAGVAHGRARELGAATLCWEVPHHVDDAVVQGLVEGTVLHAYRFDRYKQGADEDDDDDRARGPERLILSAHHDVSDAAVAGSVLATAQNRARDLGNTPANDLTPAALAVDEGALHLLLTNQETAAVTVELEQRDWPSTAATAALVSTLLRSSLRRVNSRFRLPSSSFTMLSSSFVACSSSLVLCSSSLLTGPPRARRGTPRSSAPALSRSADKRHSGRWSSHERGHPAHREPSVSLRWCAVATYRC